MRPLIIAHRGASAAAPENTGVAIRRAFAMRADAVELDVQLTRDRRAVIFHDDRLERTTNGRGRLADHSYSELRRLDAGSWFGPAFKQEPVLLASEALALAKPHRVNLELKRPRRDRSTGLADRVCRILQRTNSVGRVLVSSFDADLLARAKLKLPRLAVALITKRSPSAALRRAAELGCSSWHPHRALVKPSLVKQAHRAGMRVHAWTVDRPAEAKRLVRMGVDGVFTNAPDRIRKAFQ